VATFHGSAATIHFERFGHGPDIVWIAGGGSPGSDWHPFQMPHFRGSFRNTTFDNRGIGRTTCERPLPWPVEDFARDTAELIREVCEPPVALVGLSFGSAIAQQVCIDVPALMRCAVVMGTGAWCTGWDFQEAEIESRSRST
jgi:pimeloyl-ACP methyl ester carboxylesterase